MTASARPVRGRGRAVVPALIAGIGFLLLSATWAITSPLMASPDEAAHVARAVSLVHGDLLGEPRAFDNEETGQQAVLYFTTAPAGYLEIANQTACLAEGGPAGCGPPITAQPGTIPIASAAGGYPPLWYAVSGLPSRVLDPVEALYGGRLLQALVGSLVLAIAVWAAARLAGRLGVLVTVLGTTPTALFLLGSINPNGMEIAAAILLWLSTMLYLTRPDGRWLAALVVGSAVGTAWSRPLSPLIAAGIVATTLALVVDRPRWEAVRRSGTARLTAAGVAVAVVSAGVWVVWSGALTSFVGVPSPALTPGVAASASLALTGDRAEQMVGRFGLLNVELPIQPVLLWALPVAVVVVLALWLGSWRQRGVIVALAAATVLLPVLAESATAEDMGLTWQGRYTMPVAVGVLTTAIWILRDGRRRLPQWSVIGFGVLVAAALVGAHVAAHLQTISRYSTGLDSGWLTYLSSPVWSPPGPDVLLLVATVVGAVLVAVAPWVVRPDTAAPAPDDGAGVR